MQTTYLIRFAFLGMLCAVGCGKYDWNPPIATMQMGLDGVKLIVEGEPRGDVASHFNQDRYEVDEKQRLLLRFEAFSAEVSRINVEGDNKVWMEVSLLSVDQVEAGLAALQLCPVTRHWMMLATWEAGHPFGGTGRWNASGGDFDSAGCVLPQLKAGEERTFRYDVTKWFNDYPRGRNENFGFVLIAGSPLQIHGDRSGTFAPRFFFDSYTPSLER